MWCDSFDADLLKVVPGAVEALGDMAAVEMLTYSRPADGKINCPSAWHEHSGLTAYFWTDPQFRPPSGYVTDEPVIPCTFLEVARDEWVHGQLVCVNGVIVWQPPQHSFDALMHDLRGWTRLGDAERGQVQQNVIFSLARAADALRLVLRTALAEPIKGENVD